MKQKPTKKCENGVQLRPASIEEAGLFYSELDEKQDEALGTVGHIRMDFGSGGKEFWHTWWPHNADRFNTLEFKEDLQAIVDTLRANGPLKDLASMSSYCHKYGGAITEDSRSFGYVAETDHYRYCLRCTPTPGDYQGYLYCYDIPYGYTMRNGRTVIAQDEAAVIREIFSAYINGASLQSIAELLTERKIPYSERTDVWDKARIARIIGNAKYIGDGEYDPIIEEEQYEEAAAVKTARQRNTFEKNLEGIDLLRDLVRCAECGAPMRRRVSSKHRIRESWDCTNPDCGQRIRISDTHLLEKVTILMNRIIANSYLLIPRPKKRKELSAEAQRINREIDAELERDDPSDALIIVKTIEMAERLYAESDTHLQIAASIARKRVSLMTPQEEFSPAYFSDIAAYLTLGSGGKVILHTKTDVEIGDEENECNQDTQENNIGY